MTEFFDTDIKLSNFLTHGALITAGQKPNVMTASWGFVGVMWRKKVAIVPIRNTRFTKEIIEKTGEFTVSIPFGKKMQEELKVCGTKSGRDVDKVKELGLNMKNAKAVDTFIVDGCDSYFECKVLCKLPLDDANCPQEIKEAFYGDGNYHNFYFAEIVSEY
jgi:flavin reductase (DIM6/NTAB) family NADH-FMN oxidoreductase RutF